MGPGPPAVAFNKPFQGVQMEETKLHAANLSCSTPSWTWDFKHPKLIHNTLQETQIDYKMGGSKNWGVYPPKSSHFNRVFHDFHHPFWGTPIFGNIQMDFVRWTEFSQRDHAFFLEGQVCISYWSNFIATSLTRPMGPQIGGLVREIPLFQKNPGSWKTGIRWNHFSKTACLSS